MDGVGLMTRDNFMIISMPVEFWNDILLYSFFFLSDRRGFREHSQEVRSERTMTERKTNHG